MKDRRKTKSSFFCYAAGLLALAGLVTAAFFAPQIVFQMQDSILCRGNELGVRESVGVEALNTTYEKSLGIRMRNFAEGLAGGENYYVTVQELAVEDGIYEYVYSESALYNGILEAGIEGGLLPYDFWSSVTVRQWKQYVIYSDNYAKGVNFILWYIEMEAAGGAVLKLLADAEDNAVYAVKLEESQNVQFLNYAGRGYLREYTDNSHVALELWCFFARVYGAMGVEPLDTVIQSMESEGVYDMDVYDILIHEGAAMYGDSEENAGGAEKAGYYQEEGNRMSFRLPYGEAALDVVVDMGDVDVEAYYREKFRDITTVDKLEMQRLYETLYPDIVIGIRDIYEMIPEFA